MKRILLYLILILTTYLQSFSTKYYVDNSLGNDLSDGLTPLSAWQSLNKVNTFRFSAGDSILFKSGGQWRGQLIPQSGNASSNIIYSSYGFGEKPLLLGSLNRSDTTDWIYEGNNIWRCADTFKTDIGNIIFNNAASFGIKKWNANALTRQGDYWFDKSANVLRIYSASNPASIYSDIEAAIGNFIVYIQQGSYIVLQNLALKYGAADGIEVRNSHHITISDCDLSYIGGTELTPQLRYGGGIQFWANSNNNLVERCRIWEIYDDGVTQQGNATTGGTVQQYNIYYVNNIIWNCSESSFCYFIQPAIVNGSFMKNIYFENNTCSDAGSGWAAAQRPDPKGFQIYCSENTASTDSIFIRDNIFYKSRCVLFVDNSSVYTLSFTNMDFNCWYTLNNSDTIAAFWTNSSINVWNKSQFANYQSVNNKDLHSLMADPLFINADNNDFHLASGSPCINAGTNTSINSDFDLNPRPLNGHYDIGAYEYFSGMNVLEINNSDNIKVYPNPANSFLFVSYSLLEGNDVNIGLNDITGREVKRIENPDVIGTGGELRIENEGMHTIKINTQQLEDGVYILRFTGTDNSTSQKIVVRH